MTNKLVHEVRMNWIADSPHTEIRVSLLAYLRIRLGKIEAARDDRMARDLPGPDYDTLPEVIGLKRWIAWLSGETVEVLG